MPTPRISHVTPACTIPGGRITLHGSDFPVGLSRPEVFVGDEPARVVFASATELGLIVSSSVSGVLPVRVAGEDTGATVQVAVPIASGLHQVDSPAVDRVRTIYLTYSGTRGQQVPVSLFRLPHGRARESFSSNVTNPTSLAIGADDSLYVSSRFEGAVYKMDGDGNGEVFATDLGIACGLAFGPDGTLFVGDRSGTVFEVSTGGQARTVATLPSSVAAFHLALGNDGLYVTAPTLSARDAVYRISFGGDVAVVQGGFGRPQGIAFSPAGDLHVVEALAGFSGVYRVVEGREPELVVSGPKLVGVAFDADDMLLCSGDTAYRLPAPR